MTELTFSLATIIATAAISGALPNLTRPELFFAVTVSAEFRKTQIARHIVGRYRLSVWLATNVLTSLLLAGILSPHFAVLAMLVIEAVAFLIARHQVQPHHTNPTPLREVSLLARREQFPGGVPVMIGPFVILAAKAAYARAHWDQIPERFPLHWGVNGPDRWTDRTALSVYGSIGAVALICALLVLIAYVTIHASRRVATIPVDTSEQKFRSVSVLGLVMLAYVFAAVLPPIAGGTPQIPFAPFWILGAVGVFLVVLIWFGQGGTRLSTQQTAFSGAAPAGDRTPDQRWKLGMIYYNPDDPALVVEKRFGIGWTLNFGNRWCWIIVPLLILLPFLLRSLAS
jgi:uncharacterized membrane protein